MKLTIGMAHYSDFDGAYFTIQDIRKELIFNNRTDLLQNIEFLVVENNKHSDHGKQLNKFVRSNIGSQAEIINLDETFGTSATRNKIIEEATGQFVLVLDCHVMLCPTVKVIEDLFTFMEYNKNTNDLYTGPLVYDNMGNISTHFDDEWGGQMWGKWGNAWKCTCERYNFSIMERNKKCKFVSLVEQKEVKKCGDCGRELPQDLNYSGHQGVLSREGFVPLGYDRSHEPFEIFAQGLGLFLTRKNSWLGFNEHAQGFGGEECYIHEKYRHNNRKTICLPFLKWVHRFDRAEGVKYPLNLEYKVRNYILEFVDLGLDLAPARYHFVTENNFDEGQWNDFVEEAYKLNNKELTKGVEQSQKELIDEIESLKSRLAKISSKQKCCKTK